MECGLLGQFERSCFGWVWIFCILGKSICWIFEILNYYGTSWKKPDLGIPIQILTPRPYTAWNIPAQTSTLLKPHPCTRCPQILWRCGRYYTTEHSVDLHPIGSWVQLHGLDRKQAGTRSGQGQEVDWQQARGLRGVGAARKICFEITCVSWRRRAAPFSQGPEQTATYFQISEQTAPSCHELLWIAVQPQFKANVYK